MNRRQVANKSNRNKKVGDSSSKRPGRRKNLLRCTGTRKGTKQAGVSQ